MSPALPAATRVRMRVGTSVAPMLTKRRPVDFCLVAACLCRHC